MIIVPETDSTSVMTLAQALKSSLETYQHPEYGELTSSIGITLFQNNDTVHSLLGRVDQAMYQSKHHGRNAITFLE